AEQSYLPPDTSKSTSERSHSKRVTRMKMAKLTIESALDKLQERYDSAYRHVNALADTGTAKVDLDRYWEQIKGAKLMQDARQLAAKLDSYIAAEESLIDKICAKLAQTTASPLAYASSPDQLASDLGISAAAANIVAHSSSPEAVDSTEHPSQNASPVTSNIEQQTVQLRSLELPTFDGDPAQFYSFWAAFKTMVHNNPSLTLANKFLYLIESLKGNAASVVEAYDIADPHNYDLAIGELLRRFDSPEFTHNHFLQKLEQLPPSSDTAFSQRITLCRIRACVLQLQRFEDTSQSLSLKNLIRRKFPRETQLEVIKMENRQSGKVWNLDELLEGFNKYIEELEKIDDRTLSLSTAKDKPVHPDTTEDVVESRSTTPPPPYNPNICCFCAAPPRTVTVVEDPTISFSVLHILFQHRQRVVVVTPVNLGIITIIPLVVVILLEIACVKDVIHAIRLTMTTTVHIVDVTLMTELVTDPPVTVHYHLSTATHRLIAFHRILHVCTVILL
ncbi:hypothetical protein OESDEN_16966, partial [Oesophagostomum dentatum]